MHFRFPQVSPFPHFVGSSRRSGAKGEPREWEDLCRAARRLFRYFPIDSSAHLIPYVYGVRKPLRAKDKYSVGCREMYYLMALYQVLVSSMFILNLCYFCKYKIVVLSETDVLVEKKKLLVMCKQYFSFIRVLIF